MSPLMIVQFAPPFRLRYTRKLPESTTFGFTPPRAIGVFQLKRPTDTQPVVLSHEAPLLMERFTPDLSEQYCHSPRSWLVFVGSTSTWKPSPPRIGPQPNGPVSDLSEPLSCVPPTTLPGLFA